MIRELPMPPVAAERQPFSLFRLPATLGRHDFRQPPALACRRCHAYAISHFLRFRDLSLSFAISSVFTTAKVLARH